MAFPSVPEYSKNQIRKAGKILRDQSAYSQEEISRALDLTNAWRVSHGYPINTFRATLTNKTANGYGERIIAQRLKRLPTIVDKLKRYPNMQITTMQDIAGLRAVLKNVRDLYKLVNEYKNTRFEHKLLDIHDYVNEPRREDGYRSIHLVYEYVNNRGIAQQYNGLRVELQFRTRLQHSWATAVETMGTIISQSLKTRHGDEEWLRFFALVSSAFAHIEKTPKVPGFEMMSREQTFAAVRDTEAKLRVLERLESMNKAISLITDNTAAVGSGRYYHLVTLDLEHHRVTVRSFTKRQYEQAAIALEQAEKAAAQSDTQTDSVLVAVSDLKVLQQAYPNYFMDVNDFIGSVRRIIRESSFDT